MKKSLKSISVLTAMVLIVGFTGSITVFANTNEEDTNYEYWQETQAESEVLTLNKIINQYDLEKVKEVPDNIKPIYVENEKELSELLEQLNVVFSDTGTATDTLDGSEVINNNISTTNRITPASTPVINNKTLRHTENIFDLTSIPVVGGKIISEIEYTYSYWVAPERYNTTVNYHDVYETGPYIAMDVTYNDKSYNNNGSTITANVRGVAHVYLDIYGEHVIKTFRFNESYTIYTGTGTVVS